jgi:hypothetical protein
MDYRGEKIRLSKKYVDYDDDKNDPANLAASEISRVDAAFRMLLTRYRLGSSAVVGARCQCGISQKDGFACVFVDGAVTGPPASA